MSKTKAHKVDVGPTRESLSPVRTGLFAVLVAAGIGWIVWYLNWIKPDGEPAALADITRWNFLIGFSLIFLGLIVSSHRRAPLGRGRGVVVGMLGSFLIGLLWIVLFYIIGTQEYLPLMGDLSNYNLLVGVAFMAVGFVFATKWE